MEGFWEVLKIILPALIVLATTYVLLKNYLDKQYDLKTIEYKESQQRITLPMKLQAYERLSLFTERINLPSLVFRLRAEGSTVTAFRVALMMAVQQEYEHNITQQIYVSRNLWEILRLAKDNVVNIVDEVAETLDPNADADELGARLLQFADQQSVTMQTKALEAIKKEAALVL